MAIVIRKNGALNAAAEGAAQGYARGLEQKDRNDARKKAQDAEDARLRLAETVAQAEMDIAKEREGRQAQEFGIQQRREADRKTAAAEIGEYATSGGFKTPYADEDSYAADIARRVGQNAPELLPAFLDEYKNNKRLQMLKGVAARELSGWEAAGKNPIMGPMMAGDGKNKNELQARADTAREALQAAMQEGTDPDVLAKAVATSAAARQQSWISTAQQMDVQAEVENVSAVAGQQINEAEQALQDPRFARVLTPEVRAQMQMGISRARQALMLYGASAGQPGGMTAERLYSAMDRAFGGMGRGTSRGGADKTAEQPPDFRGKPMNRTESLKMAEEMLVSRAPFEKDKDGNPVMGGDGKPARKMPSIDEVEALAKRLESGAAERGSDRLPLLEMANAESDIKAGTLGEIRSQAPEKYMTVIQRLAEMRQQGMGKDAFKKVAEDLGVNLDELTPADMQAIQAAQEAMTRKSTSDKAGAQGVIEQSNPNNPRRWGRKPTAAEVDYVGRGGG